MARGLTGAGLAIVQFGGGRFGTGPRPADHEVCGSAAFAVASTWSVPTCASGSSMSTPRLIRRGWQNRVLAELSGAIPFASVGYDAAGTRLVPRRDSSR